MDISGLFEALGSYFVLPFYAIAYYFESYINSYAVLLQIYLDSLFNIYEALESGINSILAFVAWLPLPTFALLVLMFGLLIGVVLIRVVTKVLETLPGGMGGWLK